MTWTDDLTTTSYGGLLYDSLEEYLEVIEGLTQYLEKYPQCATAYNNRGMAYAEIGENNKALDDFTKAVEYDASNIVHFLNRARHYQVLNEPERAATDYLAAKHLKNTDTTNS